MAYSWYRSVTIDHTKCGSSSSANFPALFSGTYTYLKTVGNGGLVTNASGYDIAFYADSAGVSLLDFELVNYDATTGTVEFWVRIPSLSNSVDTVIYLFYANPTISTYQGNTNGTWNSNFKLVYHLPDGTTLTAVDSTSGGRNGTLVNTPTATTGQIDGAGNFVKASSQLIKNVASTPVSTFPVTMSCWARISNTTYANGEFRALLALDELTANPDAGFLLYTENIAGDHRFGVYTNHGANTYTILKTVTFDTSWHQYFAVYTDSSTYSFYIDGVMQTGLSSFGVPGSANPTPDSVSVGARIFNTTSIAGPWEGDLDEAHFLNVALGADWILSEYNNQFNPSTFYTVGAATPVGGGGAAGSFNLSRVIGFAGSTRIH